MENTSSIHELVPAPAAPLPLSEASDTVKDFLRRTQAQPLAETALRLVRELFPDPDAIQLEVSRDPEEKAEWLAVQVTAHGTTQALTASYRAFVARWVRETPPDKRHLVCLTYG